MTTRIKNLIPLLALLLCTLSAKAQQTTYPSFQNETLSYVVSYKWGLVQKDAATAKLSLINRPNTYEIKLTASTLPWADKIFCVRDTLASWISRKDFRPVKYVKTTHENGKYNKDVLVYSYNGSKVTGTCNRTRVTDGKTRKSVYTSSVTGKAFDMVSIFYYIRSLDFGAMAKGKTVKANILSGSSPEIITITNLGPENTKMPDGKTYHCYHIRFTFTTDSGKSVSFPMDTWITTGTQHIPVKLIGTLPIGKVRAFLTGVNMN